MIINQKFEEVTVSTKKLFQGKVISLEMDQVQLPNGQTATREIVRHPGAVAVLAFIGDRMLVVEQYRKALGRSEVEIPAGKLEPGEDPMEAAGRELAEETGYRCDALRLIHSFYTAPGFCDEIIHLYVAGDLQAGEMNPDEDEFLDCEAITLTEALEYIRQGRISDAKTIIAVYAWSAYVATGKFMS